MVKLDPIYAYFSPSDEQTYKILSSKKLSDISVRAKLTDGSEYRYKGKIDFVNNEVDQATSTVAMRAVIPNPDKILLPGVYVNLTLELGEAANTLVVPEKAISEDQAGEYVIIIGKNEKAQKKYVKTAHRYNGNITVTSGLNGGEFVVTEGMQTIRPGMNVRIKMAQKSKGRTFRDVLVRAVFGD
jgi:RND family efflux transporter MFP subunit